MDFIGSINLKLPIEPVKSKGFHSFYDMPKLNDFISVHQQQQQQDKQQQ